MKRSEYSLPARLKAVDKMSLSFVLPIVLFYFVVGLLLILLKNLVTDVAAWALAAALVLVGAWLVIRYFHSEVGRRIAGVDLAVGLVLLLAGVLLIFNPADMKEVFPKIWGLSLIFGGFLKIQYAFDEKIVKIKRWWIMLILAVVSLVIGVLALMYKSIFEESQHLIIGIFLLSEAVLDLVIFFLITSKLKKENAAAGPNSASEFTPPVPPETPSVPVPPSGPAPTPQTEQFRNS